MLSLIHARRQDCGLILEMQKVSFGDIFKKYKDTDTSPVMESIDDIYRRFDQAETIYYLVMLQYQMIGVLRIFIKDGCRIGPLFITPKFQGFGYAKKALHLVEKLHPVKRWTLNTIEEEIKLCCLYESIGYKKTGERHQIKVGMTIVSYEKRSNTRHLVFEEVN